MTQQRLCARAAEQHGAQQSWHEFGEAKAAVESVRGFAGIAPRVLGLSDGMAGAADGSFDVGEQHVDPACAVDFGGGLTTCGDECGVRVTAVGEAAKRAKAIGKYFGIRRQAPLTRLGAEVRR